MDHLPFSPTPLEPLRYFSSRLGCNLIAKRDDLFEKAGGGSKARMLQYILADLSPENCDVFLTAGGPCSNFNRAAALMCGEIGLRMSLVEYTDEPDEYSTALNSFVTGLAGVEKTSCDRGHVPETIRLVEDDLERRGLRYRFCYAGGKSLEGIYAYYDAVREVYEQGARIDHLFVACGTGTTLTGICAGMAKYYPKAQIHAISAARSLEAEMPVLEEDMTALNAHLGTAYGFDNLHFYADYLCGGYARYSETLLDTVKECISHEGMIVDPTYSGKAFWGMVDIMKANPSLFKDKNVLFWNTGGLFNLLSVKCENLLHR